MDQFQTTFLGGYRKDLVDERLKDLVGQIEKLQQEARAAKDRENQLKEQLAEAVSRAEAAEAAQKPAAEEWSPEMAAQREDQLKQQLAEALSQLAALESGLRHDDSGLDEETARKRQKEELEAALRWSESLEAELKLVKKERDARTQNRILELEQTRALNQRILELEVERERREDEHRREVSRLQDQLNQQQKGCEAAGRILALAEREARTMVEEAQARVQRLEQQTAEEIFAKKRAAALTLEGARAQVIHYLDTFNITRDKLSATYNELDALVEQIPLADSSVIELERDEEDGGWSYTPDLGE